MAPPPVQGSFRSGRSRGSLSPIASHPLAPAFTIQLCTCSSSCSPVSSLPSSGGTSRSHIPSLAASDLRGCFTHRDEDGWLSGAPPTHTWQQDTAAIHLAGCSRGRPPPDCNTPLFSSWRFPHTRGLVSQLSASLLLVFLSLAKLPLL